jgi:hypothetical protein
MAQGGVANGNSLFIDDVGTLVFLVRQNKRAYSVPIPITNSGLHAAIATLKHDGILTLSLDDQPVAQSRAVGFFATKTPRRFGYGF